MSVPLLSPTLFIPGWKHQSGLKITTEYIIPNTYPLTTTSSLIILLSFLILSLSLSILSSHCRSLFSLLLQTRLGTRAEGERGGRRPARRGARWLGGADGQRPVRRGAAEGRAALGGWRRAEPRRLEEVGRGWLEEGGAASAVAGGGAAGGGRRRAAAAGHVRFGGGCWRCDDFFSLF